MDRVDWWAPWGRKRIGQDLPTKIVTTTNLLFS